MHKLFSLLLIFLLILLEAHAQDIPYGNNPAAGHYLEVDSTKLYYEVYGEGPPLLLLHGDFYGYIDEFSEYIPLLSKHFKVIATAKRGHGKSEIGNALFNEERYARDALAILKQEGIDSATVMGFSSGGNTALYLAAYYPARIKAVVAMAAGINSTYYRPEAIIEMRNLTYPALKKESPRFFAGREQLMPQPERFDELLQKLKKVWLAPYFMDSTKVNAISKRVLIVGGDTDDYYKVENFVYLQASIPHAQLAIIPGCTHVGLLSRPGMVKDIVLPFLLNTATLQ